jgi:hypothetical protein
MEVSPQWKKDELHPAVSTVGSQTWVCWWMKQKAFQVDASVGLPLTDANSDAVRIDSGLNFCLQVGAVEGNPAGDSVGHETRRCFASIEG